MKLGFIGLGQMGTGMATSLLKAGHEVTVYNRSPDKTKPLVELGARAAKTVAEACQNDAVFTMLADDKAVEGVSFGPDGILAHLPAQALHISSSTISVTLSTALAAAHEKAGQRYVGAPVFGRPDAAAAEDLQVAMPVASLLRDRFLTLIANGGANLDWSALGKLAAKDSGQTGPL